MEKHGFIANDYYIGTDYLGAFRTTQIYLYAFFYPDFEKEYYQKLMAEHLPELRKTLGISQSDLAEYIGSTRQSINSIENKKRPMMWDTFMSLMLLFISNNDTKKQLDELEIDTKKISNFLKIKKKRVKK